MPLTVFPICGWFALEGPLLFCFPPKNVFFFHTNGGLKLFNRDSSPTDWQLWDHNIWWCVHCFRLSLTNCRGIEWSLRAFANMRAVRLFLIAGAVINFIMRAASTLEITNGEQRALRICPASWNLFLLKRCFAPSNLADTFKTGQQAQSHETYGPYHGSTISSSLQPIMPCLICRLLQNYFT